MRAHPAPVRPAPPRLPEGPELPDSGSLLGQWGVGSEKQSCCGCARQRLVST